MPRKEHNETVAVTIVNNPTYRDAREMVEKAIISQLKDLELTDRDTEHELVMLLRAGEQHHRMIEGYVRSGEISELNAQRRKAVV